MDVVVLGGGKGEDIYHNLVKPARGHMGNQRWDAILRCVFVVAFEDLSWVPLFAVIGVRVP